MIVNQLLYFIHKAFQNLRHFFLINLITFGIISLALLVFSTFLMIVLNFQTYLDKWKSQIQVTAYLREKITVEELEVVKQKIKSFPEVKGFTFISKEEALSFFNRRFPEQKKILEGLPENPLPASIDLHPKDSYQNTKQIKALASKVKNLPGVEEVEYGQFWIEGYLSFLNVIKKATLTVGVVILLATVFIISNTIKLTVYARKEEIAIMKLVGATNFFIRVPFFIEGIMLGLGGALVALSTLYIAYHCFIKWVAQLSYLPVQELSIVYLPPYYLILVAMGGMVTGFLGSFFSLGRYLKM
ncbi:MAG: permease-like cell division protein FtsX [Pseudomonadota bacterium]